ncbi:oxygenase MpaB family protein [Mycobacterium sp.]|uniref:oxygenase MpaB family protein n=1 Tax=Mycobacterium sp. TaxID=1785 RepID=UPI0025FEC442|nr:oxygenase MpaB family protein [Mycobacterium sp.]MBW0014593.1 DUF2236 domain-containing protein [Mycobacterium sp.]
MSAPTATSQRPEPLGPDSLTWNYLGDLRTLLLGLWIGALQNMHPGLGAGVEEHSTVLREPVQRNVRATYPIAGVVFDGDRAARTAEQIRGYHETIKGVDGAGRRYHALNPDTFYWAHATFFMLLIKTAEHFWGGLAEADKRQLFDEHVQWYRLYGMSMRPVPETWERFQDYWERMCRDELEFNKATLDLFTIRIPRPGFVPLPTRVWDQMYRPFLALQRWIAAGVFDPVVREKAGIRWTARDDVMFRLFGRAVNTVFSLLPNMIRLHPRARSAYRRAAGKIAADAPLAEAPSFLAPPHDRRGQPTHYIPPRRRKRMPMINRHR